SPEMGALLKLSLTKEHMIAGLVEQIDFEFGREISHKDDYSLKLISALDYTLGRSTSMPHTIADEIINHWDNFTFAEKEDIVEKIETAIANGRAGQFIDESKWQTVLDNAGM